MLAACDATLDVEGMTKVDDESTSLAYLGGVSQESVCGDGHVDVDEECDDSNGTESDGCNADCTVTRVVQAALG
jgi:cysteine-rich repeat protein